ncbi:GFA family protein [Iodobacter sp. HSC-16F04]|uniref:GFA family protein n=1 Tax=Iodobacter violaceini TaxID=3044271 RepID=A0ABX0KS70_9NEIS|nr:GFA family protein [Iodobacter violacea]NHQ85543.1 GFA family protein [Iodobacter violacea]
METKQGSCHCGTVVFEVDLAQGFENLRRCNCSLCSRKGAIIASVPVEGLRVIKGENMLSIYQWNTKIAKHYFCKVCGIYTHHQRRSNPSQFGFNVACIAGVNPFELGEIGVGDGAAQALLQG